MSKNGPTFGFFILVILLALFLKLFVIDIMFVSGPSMSPAVPDGSIVLNYRLAWGIPIPLTNRYLVRWGQPQPGDIVVYHWLGRQVIKRCVATAGMPLAFSDQTGYSVTAGGAEIPLTAEQYCKMRGAERVPSGMIFALGDNMAESRDSREYGFVSIDSLRGKALWK